MHRTGLTAYLLFRLGGHDPASALAFVRRARPVTAHELEKNTRKNGVLMDRAEQILESIQVSP